MIDNPPCKKCNGPTNKLGYYFSKKGKIQRYQCKKCAHIQGGSI